MTTFNPPVTPSYSSSSKSQYRVKRTEFGDGYDQVMGDGINTRIETWNLTWNGLRSSEADAIEDFMDARGGSEQFEWTTPKGVTKNFRCPDGVQRTFNKFNDETIQLTLVESKNNG